MNILVIGGGGREHAIAKKIKQDTPTDSVFCCPGNPGMTIDGIETVAIDLSDVDQLITYAKKQAIDLTIVGPEQPLLDGLVNQFQAAGLKIFGPTKEAAMIEGSKSFAKEVMQAAKVPTATYQSFDEVDSAIAYLEQQEVFPIVLKADGLAAGKGVVIAQTRAEAIQTIKSMMEGRIFGESGSRVVIEEFLDGEEFTLMAFVDGVNVYPMIPAQDHKRAFDGDKGPNTGGMGAYAPVPQIRQSLIDDSVETIMKPVARYLDAQGSSYSGILYAGLIVTQAGPKVIEFNARFGDPEAQVVLPLMESKLVEVLESLLAHQPVDIAWSNQVSLGVVVAREGYPTKVEAPQQLPDLSKTQDVAIYYSGVKKVEDHTFSNGGRVLLMQAKAADFQQAKTTIYRELAKIAFDGFYYRKDIGYRIR